MQNTNGKSKEKHINIGLIGYGYWGGNLLRNIIENPETGQISVCDLQEEKLNKARNVFPTLSYYTDWKELISNPDVQAVAIATPTSSHYEIAKAALLNGKHVLCEKPMVTSSDQAVELIQIAQDNGLILMTDHTFLYNNVVRKLKDFIKDDELGKINYIDSTRINLGIYQKDTNVVWDLACHDIAIINYLIDEKPSHIRSIGKVHPAHATEDIAYLFLYYPSGILVQISISWASPVKIRKMIIGGEKKMMIYDDIEPTNKLIIYDYEAFEPTEENRKRALVDYRLGNISIPKYHLVEPLKLVIEDFTRCILSGDQPLSDGKSALSVIRILEKAEASLRSNGDLMELN